MNDITRPPRPLRILRAAAFSGAVILALGGRAGAQVPFDDDILPPRVVAWRLADRGFTGLSRPRFDGRVYVVEAVSPSGAPVRLFVDPAMGAIVGRQLLGRPDAVARLDRPLDRPPGFGWTEEDALPRGPVRPPAEAAPRAPRRAATAAVRPPENLDAINPDGVNPDAGARPAPRRLARTSPLPQPAPRPAARVSPEAPAPRAPEAARPDAPRADIPKADAPRPEVRPAEAGPEARPPAPGKVPPAEAASPAPEGARAEAREAQKPAAQDWKDLPPESRRPVRVIGGATVVPGTAEKDPATPAQ